MVLNVYYDKFASENSYKQQNIGYVGILVELRTFVSIICVGP